MKNGFKRALSMLLCLTMVLGLFCYAPEASALVDSSGYECTGSVEQLLRASSDAVAGQCYRIVNNDDIIALADYVAAGRNTKGVTFYLKADVDMRRNTGNGIGTDKYAFEGTLDGCGYAVVGLITYLFKNAGSNAVIMNLGDPTEDLRVHLLTRAEVLELLRTDRIRQSLMAAPLWRYFAENPASPEGSRAK